MRPRSPICRFRPTSRGRGWIATGAPTWDLILRLHPDTRRIAFVSGGGTTPSTAVEFERVAASYRDRFEPVRLTDRTFEEMLKEAAALPEHTIILVGLFLRDRAGRTFTNAEVAEHVARTASVPVYSALDVHVGRGIVGGYVARLEQQAARAAALGLRVLRGERLGPAATTSEGTNAYVFDARVLKRWRIDRRRLVPAVRAVLRGDRYVSPSARTIGLTDVPR